MIIMNENLKRFFKTDEDEMAKGDMFKLLPNLLTSFYAVTQLNVLDKKLTEIKKGLVPKVIIV